MIQKGVNSLLNPDNEPIVLIEEVMDFGMITVKADFSDPEVCNSLKMATKVELPRTGKISFSNKISVGWMSTDERAIILKKTEADKIRDLIEKKMKNHDCLCVDISDSRRCFRLFGEGWREVLSKGSPIDLNPSKFGRGNFRRTRIANLAVAIWSVETDEAYLFSMCSVGEFILDWLNNANLKSDQINYYS